MEFTTTCSLLSANALCVYIDLRLEYNVQLSSGALQVARTIYTLIPAFLFVYRPMQRYDHKIIWGSRFQGGFLCMAVSFFYILGFLIAVTHSFAGGGGENTPMHAWLCSASGTHNHGNS